MAARALLAWTCLGLAIAGSAGAVTVDDFTAGYPSPGGVVTGPSGVGQLTQSSVFILGSTRETRVTSTNPIFPSGVTIIPNPSPPPVKNVLEAVVGGAGGNVRLGYPGLTSYDVTFGVPPVAFPTMIEVLAALMVAGGTIELTLSDSTGASATDSHATADFFGPSPIGTDTYGFFPTPASFPGVDLTDIEELAVRVALPTGADFELSEIRIVPVAAAAVSWDRAFAFESAGATADPRVLVGFDVHPPDPIIPPVLDLSDPTRPSISWVSGVQPDPFFEILVGVYGGVEPTPFIGPGAALEVELTNAATYRMVFEISSSDGQVLDPGSLVGFNPQPEPPLPSLFDWASPPPDDGRVGFGLSLGLQPPPGFAPAGLGGPTVTLSFQILDAGGTPIALAQASPTGTGIPALPFSAALALVAGLAALLALRRSARAREPGACAGP